MLKKTEDCVDARRNHPLCGVLRVVLSCSRVSRAVQAASHCAMVFSSMRFSVIKFNCFFFLELLVSCGARWVFSVLTRVLDFGYFFVLT